MPSARQAAEVKAFVEDPQGFALVKVTDPPHTHAPRETGLALIPTFDTSLLPSMTISRAPCLPVRCCAVQAAFESTTSFGKLKAVNPTLAGRNLFLRFVCMSGDAMGMNMISKGCLKVRPSALHPYICPTLLHTPEPPSPLAVFDFPWPLLR